MRFHVGQRVQKTAQYPEAWTRREFVKSRYGVVLRVYFWLGEVQVKRDGKKTPDIDPEQFWEPVTGGEECECSG